MKEREGRAATGQPILPRADLVRYEEVAQDLRQHYRTTGCRSVKEAEKRLKHLVARRLTGTFSGTPTGSALDSRRVTL